MSSSPPPRAWRSRTSCLPQRSVGKPRSLPARAVVTVPHQDVSFCLMYVRDTSSPRHGVHHDPWNNRGPVTPSRCFYGRGGEASKHVRPQCWGGRL